MLPLGMITGECTGEEEERERERGGGGKKRRSKEMERERGGKRSKIDHALYSHTHLLNVIWSPL